MTQRKSQHEIEVIREAGQIVAKCLKMLSQMIEPGVTTLDLDKKAEEYILAQGGIAAFKGYQGFPASICVSVNEEVVHGIPSPRQLAAGDIVGVDVGVKLKGYFADAAATFPVGKISEEAENLLEATRNALQAGIEQCRVGRHLSDISHAIQKEVERGGFSVVRKFVGHGIGRKMHEPPQIPNYGPPGQGMVLEPGMVFALEPMVNAGGYEVEVLPDKWTVVTVDGSLSAHCEHTVVVTEEEPSILTRP